MTTRRRGMTLLLVIVLIGMMGVFSVLLARTLASTWHDTRRVELAARARQLLASGVEWASAHPSDCAALSPGAIRQLDAHQAAPNGGEASLTLTRGESMDHPNLKIESVVRLGKISERAVLMLNDRK